LIFLEGNEEMKRKKLFLSRQEHDERKQLEDYCVSKFFYGDYIQS